MSEARDLKPDYITDESGQKKAVILSLKTLTIFRSLRNAVVSLCSAYHTFLS